MKSKIIQFFLSCLLISTFAFGETRNIVPRGPGEGSIGTSEKPWGDGWFDDLHVDGNSIFSNLEGTNGVIVNTTESGALVGLDTNSLTSLPKFLKWDGTNIVWDDKFNIPEGMDVPAYLASLNVPNFMQQQSVEVPGIVTSIYENNPGEELVSEIDFGTRELGRFDVEEITGPSQFIVTETNGYYGKFNSSVEYTKVRPGVCIVINGQYYPIADITDGDGWGTRNGSVKLSLPLVPGETYDVERYSGISSGEGYSRLSYAFDPDGAGEQFRAEPTTWYTTGWCCTPDFRVHYIFTGMYIYKSTDFCKTWKPVLRVPSWFYTSLQQHYFANMTCSPDGESVLVSITIQEERLMQTTSAGSYWFKTTNSFKTFESTTSLSRGSVNVKDVYCAGSNKWGSLTWIIPCWYDYVAAGIIVSTNNMESWDNYVCIAGNTRVTTAACDPDLTTIAYVAGNNSRTIIVGELSEPTPSSTFSKTTSYSVSSKVPFRLRFERVGEYGEFVNTNIIVGIGVNDNNVRLDEATYIHYLNRETGFKSCIIGPWNSRILNIQPLINERYAMMHIPGSCFIGTFGIQTNEITGLFFTDPKKEFATVETGSSFWRSDGPAIENNNNVYDSLKINKTRPNVWYMAEGPRFPRMRISQDYGVTWKIFGLDAQNIGDIWNNNPYVYQFPISGLDDKFIFAWPTPHNSFMKYDDSRFKSLVLFNNDMTDQKFIDGNPFFFYDLCWPVSNRLYAIVSTGNNGEYRSYDRKRLAVSEDIGKTWYFPGGPGHAGACWVYAQSYTDAEGDIVTNVTISNHRYSGKRRPWLWNSKTDKWTSLEQTPIRYRDWADNGYYNKIYIGRLYDGGNGWDAAFGWNTSEAHYMFRVTNALSYAIKTDKSFQKNIGYNISKWCNLAVADDPETGEELWYYGMSEYNTTDYKSRITVTHPDNGDYSTYEPLPGSPTGRCERIEAVSKDIIWASISTNAASRWNVWKTTNGGETFENVTAFKEGLGNKEYFSLCFGLWPIDENHCYISQGNSFYETLDGGTTWTYKGRANFDINCYSISGDHANRANTNMIWYVLESESNLDDSSPRVFYTTNQFATSEVFAWNEYPKKMHPDGVDYLDLYMCGLYSPTWNPNIVYSGIVGGWPMVSRDGGASWDYIGDPTVSPDDPAYINQFTRLTDATPDWGWQVTGYGDVVIYTKTYGYYSGDGWANSDIQSEVFISYEGELAGKPRIFQKLDLPDKYTTGNCPIARNGCVYAGNEIILNQGESFCYYNSGPDLEKLVGNNQTMITKTNGIDSARWAQIEEVAVDSLYSKLTKSAVTVLFSFDQGNSYKRYNKQNREWETIVYKDAETGIWYYRKALPRLDPEYIASPTQTPQAAISIATQYELNRFSDEEISQVTDLEWNYLGAFDSETTSNMMFSVTFIPAEEYNGKAEVPAIYDVSFKTVMKSDLYTKKDNNYLVTQQEGETSSTVTKTNSAVANSVIYYLRNIP